MAPQSTYERPAETEISLHDIFWYIVKNWIILLICMAIFGAFFGIYKKSAQTKTVQAAAKAVEEYNALTKEEQAKVKAADVPKAVAESTISAAFKKYLVLGAFVGLFAGAALLAVYFVVMGFLPNGAAVERRYHLPAFGILPDEKKNRLQRAILNKLTYSVRMSEAESLQMVAARLSLYITPGDKLLLVGTIPAKRLKKVEKHLAPLINTPLTTAGNVNNQANAVMALNEGCKVICVEQILKSKQTYVDFAMNTIAASNSECVGFILVE